MKINNRFSLRLLPAAMFASALFLVGSAQADCSTEALQKLATAEHRNEGNADRNKWRNPVETLQFFGLRPNMTVVEISPGGGAWYTEILAPYLREKGTLYLGSFDPESTSEYSIRNSKRLAEKLAAHPDVYDKAKVTVFNPSTTMAAAPEGSADLVLTFRNMHNWMSEEGSERADAALAAMHSYLREGGILGVVAHRGRDGEKYIGDKGYLTEKQVISFVEKAGFVLLDKSEVNANPKDTKDHEFGVWSLPPVMRGAEDDAAREKMKAMGESDRMTLKFMKPVVMDKG